MLHTALSVWRVCQKLLPGYSLFYCHQSSCKNKTQKLLCCQLNANKSSCLDSDDMNTLHSFHNFTYKTKTLQNCHNNKIMKQNSQQSQIRHLVEGGIVYTCYQVASQHPVNKWHHWIRPYVENRICITQTQTQENCSRRYTYNFLRLETPLNILALSFDSLLSVSCLKRKRALIK